MLVDIFGSPLTTEDIIAHALIVLPSEDSEALSPEFDRANYALYQWLNSEISTEDYLDEVNDVIDLDYHLQRMEHLTKCLT